MRLNWVPSLFSLLSILLTVISLINSSVLQVQMSSSSVLLILVSWPISSRAVMLITLHSCCLIVIQSHSHASFFMTCLTSCIGVKRFYHLPFEWVKPSMAATLRPEIKQTCPLIIPGYTAHSFCPTPPPKNTLFYNTNIKLWYCRPCHSSSRQKKAWVRRLQELHIETICPFQYKYLFTSKNSIISRFVLNNYWNIKFGFNILYMLEKQKAYGGDRIYLLLWKGTAILFIKMGKCLKIYTGYIEKLLC